MLKLHHLLFTFLLLSCTSKESDLKKIFSFPKNLKEVSGIEADTNSNRIWVLQDKGNEAAIFSLDSSGKIVQTIQINNVQNNDWEDLSKDANGNFYIGDFGNNDNIRRDLAIYKLDAAQLESASANVSQKTTFYFPEQKEFPPKKSERIFDVESFFILGDYFYLFTKNRSANFDGTTVLYQVPNQSGNHAAKLIGQFKTCGIFKQCAITSAAISPNGSTVALLTSTSVWLFTKFSSNNFLSGKVQEIDLHDFSQKEGLCFVNNSKLLICDEKDKKSGGNVYELDLANSKSEP